MTRPWLLLPLLALVACPPDDPTSTDVLDTDGDTDADTDWDTTGLRPNVQDGIPPNAVGQEPAFPQQTRALQPAEPTDFTIEVLASGLENPWGLARLPDGRLLVTERPGRLRLVDTDGSISAPLDGTPEAAAVGQGGLLDIALDPDFDSNRRVYFTFAEDRGGGSYGASVARGALSGDADAITGLQVIYRQQPAWRGGRHFGSRLVFAEDGTLYVTFGDRGSAFADAQDADNAIGAVIRINPDGSAPADNPFADGVDGAPEVWSWGHRNIQSATLGLEGRLWTVEHGAQGGDELNQPEAGVNHGWPIITYGQDYNGSPVGEGLTEQEGLAQPVYYWDPVIAPAGMATYRGELFEGWEGDLLVGGLQSQSVVRLSLRGGLVFTEEWLSVGRRVRAIEVAPDGSILLATDQRTGEILRLVPE